MRQTEGLIFGDKVQYTLVKKVNRGVASELVKSNRPYYQTHLTKNGDLLLASAKDNGSFLSFYILDELKTIHNLDDNFTYIEINGDYLYWVHVDVNGVVNIERLVSLSEVSGKAQIIELKKHLNQYSGTEHIVVQTKNASPQNSTFLSKTEICVNGICSKIIENDNSFKIIESVELIFGETSIEELKVNIKYSTQISTTLLKKQNRVVTIGFTVIGVAFLSLFVGYKFLQAENIKEAEASKARNIVQEIIDPYKNYKETVSNPNRVTRLETALRQIGYVTATFSKANFNQIVNNRSPLNWSVDAIKVQDRAIFLTPKSLGGKRKELSNFAAKYNLALYTKEEEGLKLAMGMIKAPLQPFFHRSIDSELDYITDAVQFLEDDTSISLTGRAVNGSGEAAYTIGLVKVDFKCWLPEDFVYVGTQFASRNYSLHSLDAKGVVTESIDEQCGYSGFMNIEVFSKF